MIYAVVAAIYAIGFTVTLGAMMADSMAACRRADLLLSYYRKDLALAVFFALVPILWIAVLFFTGFYEHGWRISREPGLKALRANPER